MKLISVIIAWCSCKGPGRSHLLLMAYAACVFARAPIKQTELQKLVRHFCSPPPHTTVKSTPFLPSDIFLTDIREPLSPSPLPCTSELSPSPFLSAVLPIALPRETQTREVLHKTSVVQGNRTENESSRFCSATNLDGNFREIS